MMKKAEKKRVTFMASLGELNRPLRVRPVNVEGRNWWAIDPDQTWPGMVMDLRRLGFESMAYGEEVLVRESMSAYEPQMEGPNAQGGLRSFPVTNPRINIWREFTVSDDLPPSYSNAFSDTDPAFLNEFDEDTEDVEEDEEIEPDEDLHYE
jgi:hypothetical protein